MVDRTQIDAMADVIRKLGSSVDSAAHNIVTESKHNPDLGFAVEAQRTDAGVTVSCYDIRTEKKDVTEGFNKTFYHVIDNRNGETVAGDLGLFESAMGIVKHLLYTNKLDAVNKLVQFDAAYVGNMVETFSCKQRMRRLDESTAQYDVAAAKHSQSRQQMRNTKMKILKAL
jgi:hypothetical protein